MRHFLCAFTTALAVGLAGIADASTWKIDPGHTTAQFAVRHLMVSTVRGSMAPVTGIVTLDEADLTRSTVESTIDVNGIDTREAKRDAHLKSADFFDAAKHPTITFKSKTVTKLADTKFQVAGDLTIRGVTKEVVLDVDGQPKPVQDHMGNLRLGGMATTKLQRKDFGITWTKVLDGGGVVVGDEVTVTIDFELVKAE